MESDEEPPPPLAILKQAKAQETKELYLDREPAVIAAEITALPSGWQAEAFHQLPRSTAIAVYQFLDTGVQQRLIEDFKKRDDINVCDELSSDEREQLFELLYIPKTHNDDDINQEPVEQSDDSSNSPLAIVKR